MNKKPFWERDWLWNEYIIKEKSISQIAREQKVVPPTIRYHLIKNDIPIRESNNGKKQYPNLGSSPALAYILGVIAGDGLVRGHNRIVLGTKDFEFAQEFADALRSIDLRAYVKKDDRWNRSLQRQQKLWRCYAYSAVFVDWYRNLTRAQFEGIVRQYPREYLKGFFESEGTYIVNTNGSACIHFSSINYELLLIAQRLLTLLGYESKIYEYKFKDYFSGQEKTIYRLSLLGSSEKKHEFIRKLKPVIKNHPYDYSDLNGHRGRKPKDP